MKIGSILKKIFLFFIIAILLNFSIIMANAETNDVNLNIYSSQSIIYNGQRLYVTLKLNPNYEEKKGLNAYKATLVYDKDIFEKVVKEDFVSLNDWEKLEYNENTGEFVAIKRSGITSAEDVVRISLRVKNDFNKDKAEVVIKDVVTSNGKKDISTDNKKITLNLVKKNNASTLSNVNNSQNNNGSNINDNNDNNNNEIKPDDKNTNDDQDKNYQDSVTDNDLEDEEDVVSKPSFYVFLLIIFIILILILLFLIYKNLKDDKKNNKRHQTFRVLMVSALGILSILSFNTAKAALYDYSLKGELNNDGKVDYSDLSILEFHLINKKLISNDFLDRGDMNDDKVITVTDLSLLIRKLENKLDYEVKLDKVTQESSYVSKNSEFLLKFKGNVSYGAKISKVKIDEKYYEVEESDIENGLYLVKLNSSSNSGKKEYNFTEVVLNNGKTIKVDFKESINVLKSKPVFNSYSVKENLEESFIEVSFDLADSDDALTSSKVLVLNNSDVVMREYPVKKGVNTIKISATGDEIYKLKIAFDYNLTGDKWVTDSKYVGKEEISKEVQLIKDYNFFAGNFRTVSDNEVKDTFSKNEQIRLYFESNNISRFVPEKIKVNGKNYDIIRENDSYYAVLNGFNMLGSNVINITAITLNNGKVFDIEKDNKIIVNIIKNVPSISNFKFEENRDNNELVLRFRTNNEDNAIKELMINISDDNNALIKQVKISESELNGSKEIIKEISNLPSNVSNYHVEIIGSYALDIKGNNVVDNVVFYDDYFIASFAATISESSTNKEYYEKGEEAVLTYTITTNGSHDIDKIVINDKEYKAEKIGNNLYKVLYKVKDISGIENINVSHVLCSSGNITSVSNKQTIEVLKDAPVVGNVEQKDNYDDSKVTVDFKLLDKDGSFINGEAVFKDKNGSEVKKQVIKKGDNSVTFDVRAYSKYTFNINAVYDRDNLVDNINNYNKTLFTKDINGLMDYKLSIMSIRTLKNGKPVKYFDKKDKVNVEFISSNATKNKISNIVISGKKYDVENEDDKYNTVIDAPSNSGVQNLSIDKVILRNKDEVVVKSNNKFNYEVLKDAPVVKDYKQIDNAKESKTYIEFNLDDHDNSLISGEAVLKDSNGKVSAKSSIKKGKNNIVFDVEPEKKYKFEIITSYDRDVVIDSINNYKNKVLLTKNISGINDYKLVINDLKAYKDNSESKYFEKNDKINIQFQSTNETNNTITEVTVNSKKYAVTKVGNIYRATINGFDKAGINSVVIEKVKLSNSKELAIKSNNSIEVEILKDAPIINDLKVSEADDDLNVAVDFKINDFDKSFINGEVLFKNSNGTILSRKQIVVGSNSFKFNVEPKVSYIVDVNITYDRDSVKDNVNRFENKCIASKKIDAINDYRLVIDNIKTKKDDKVTKYFNKNEIVNIEFESTNITKKDISEITINGSVYQVSKKNGKYNVAIDSPAKSGIHKFKIEKIKLNNSVDIEVHDSKIFEIEVLKDSPTISGYKQTDNVKESKSIIEFTLNDVDNSFVKGEALLKDSNGKVISKHTIRKGQNKLEVSIEPENSYVFSVVVSYNLGLNDKDNIFDNVELLNKKLKGITDYRLSLTDLKTMKDNKDNKYFEKNEKINFNFNSSNVTKYVVSEVVINGKKYKVTNNNGNYSTLIDGIADSGVHELVIEKVKLSNSKEFIINANNKVEVEILKDAPIVSDLKVSEIGKDLIAKVDFDITDKDHSFVNGEVLLKDNNGTLVTKKTIKAGKNSVDFKVEPDVSYTADVIISYDRDSVVGKDNMTNNKKVASTKIDAINNYWLTISDIATNAGGSESKYFEKNDSVNIEFKSSNVSSYVVNKVIINSKEYSVIKNGDIYSVSVPGFSESGKHELTINKVILSNNAEIEIKENNNIEIEVLKDAPLISGYTQNTNVKESLISIEFTLEDLDNSLTEGEALLKDKNGKTVSSISIVKGKNKIEYNVEPETSYVVDYKVTYSRDIAKSEENKVKNKVLLSKKLDGITDYKLEISNIKALKDDKISKYYKKNEKIKLTFESTNVTKYVIKEVFIDNKKYDVTKTDDTYVVLLDGFDLAGSKTISIDKVVLSNSKELAVKSNNKIIVDILKDAPKISNFNVSEISDDLKLNVKFNFEDNDNSLEKGLLELKDNQGKIISSKQIKVGNNSYDFSVESKKAYIVEVKVTYDLDSSSDNINKVTDKRIAYKEIEALNDYKLVINNVKTKKNNKENKYFEKNEKIEVEFESTNITSSVIDSIVINDKNYSVTRNDKLYTVLVDGYKNSGIYNVVIDSVTLSDKAKVDINSNNKAEVRILKDIPTISGYNKVDNVKESKAVIEFALNDLDNSFVSGEVIFKNNNKTIKTIPINKGNNSIELGIEPENVYTLDFNVSYDRYNFNDDYHKVEEKKILSKEIKGITDYKLSISNVKAIKNNKENKYFEKNEKINLTFNSSNVTNYIINEAIINGKKYNVTKIDDVYNVLVDGISTNGVKTLTIEKVKLSNSKELDVKINNKVEVEILKDAPTISEIVLSDVDKDLKVNATFELIDTENSFISGKVVFKDSKGTIVSNKAIKVGKNSAEMTMEPKTSYVVEVYVTYDRDSVNDSVNKVADKLIASKNIDAINDYKLEISKLISKKGNKENKYFEKNDKINLEFESTNITKNTIKEVTVNGKVYKVTKDNDKYSVNIDAISNSGVHTLTIEKVKLSNDAVIEVSSSNSINIEVLKDAPTISEYKQTDNAKESKTKVEFTLNDSDNSFINGQIVYKDKNGDIISTEVIKKGKNSVELVLEPETSYTLDFNVTYDRDTVNDEINKFSGKTLLNKKLNGITDYKLNISNLKATSKYYEKKAKININFNSSNATNYDISEVTINGNKYKVTKDGNVYSAEVDGFADCGVKSLTIEKVKLSNLKELEVKSNNKVEVEVLKSAPTISGFKTVDSDDDSKVKVDFNIVDADESFIQGEAILYRKDRTIVSRSAIKRGKNILEFSVAAFTDYDLEIKVTYDRDKDNDDVNKVIDKILLTEQLSGSQDYKLTINNIKSKKNNTESKYFNKNEKIDIEFESTNASSHNINDVTINGKKYNVTRNGNKYNVLVDGISSSGIKTLTIEKVTLDNNVLLDVKSDNNIRIEVLKSAPRIASYDAVIDSKTGTATLNFNLVDDDDSIIKAEGILINDRDNTEVKKNVVKGNNSLVFNIKSLNTYTFNVKVSYDLDTNTLSNVNDNRVLNKVIDTRKVEGSSEHNLTISNIKAYKNNAESKYYNKNEKINIQFNSTNSTDYFISEVTINGKKYNVTRDGNKYSALVDGFSNSGEQSIVIEKVKLSNSLEIDVNADNHVNVEILKDKPSIDGYTVEEDYNDSSVVIKFNVTDKDSSFVSGNIKVLDKNNKVVEGANVKKGNNALKVAVNDGENYKVKINLDYNMTLDKDVTDKNLIGSVTLEKDLVLNIKYNFSANNFKTFDGEEEATTFTKDKDIILKFDSSNSTNHKPSKIFINDDSYDVSESAGKYVVTIPKLDQFGSKTFIVKRIVLDNEKSFDINKQFTINVIKVTPTISDLSVSDKGERVRVDFVIKDDDNALLDLGIALYDDSDKEIIREKITSEDINSQSITKFFDGVYTSTYKAVVIGSYSLTGNDSDKEEAVVLAEKEVEATTKANIISVTSDKQYYEKGANVLLTYNIETNKPDGIVALTINDKNYSVSKVGENYYRVTYKLDSSAGVKTIKATNIVFNTGYIAKVDNTYKVEVLKNAVSVNNFKQTDNIKESKVTLNFDVNDSDKSFINGKAILTSIDDGASVTKDIKVGKNSLEFNVDESKIYKLDVKATYDRDTNTLTENNGDNLHTNRTIFTQDVQLVIDYDLNISDLGTYKNNALCRYFDKNENITLRFKSNNATEFDITDVRINGNKYSVVKNSDGFYQTELEGYATSGARNLVLERVKLSNSKELNISKNNEILVSILKNRPFVENYGYEENVQGDITFSFDLVDQEKAILKANMYVLEDGNIIREREITAGTNSIAFSPKENASYSLKVTADYDLDYNRIDSTSNSYYDVVLFENELSLGKRHLQVKDIVSTDVYTQTTDGVKRIDNVNVSDLSNLDKFIVKVNPKDMPAFYTTIESYSIDNNRLKLTLKYDDIVQYDGNKKLSKLVVDAGKVNNGTIEDDSLAGLIDKINANPSGNFELTRDYDASLVSPSLATAVTEKFTGTLNGNGHKIINLNKPLFNELEGATIKNIVFSNVKLSGATSHGTIANIATDTNVTNVHVKGLDYTTGAAQSAGLIGEGANINVEKSSVTDFVITTAGHIRVAGIIGYLNGGSIKNCYAQGEINSTQTKDGNGMGGILGHGYGVENIENCITKIVITNNQGARLNGAVVGLFINRTSTLKNNVSLSSGQNFYSVYGNGGTVTATNNYELSDSGLVSNEASGRYNVISKNAVNSNFFKNDAKFDDTIWNLSGVSYNKLPVLRNDDPNGSTIVEDTSSPDVYIPDYNRVKKVSGYKKSNEILYHNIYRLMPYYDAKFLVEDSIKIASDNVLATKLIKHILPYSQGKLLTYITVENYNTISDIKVVFNDMTVSSYKVNFKELNQNISIYEIEGLGIDYAPDNYLIRNDANIVNILKTYIEGIDYNTTLEPLTEAADARHYRDNFNEVIKKISLELSLKLLANYSDAVTISSEILDNKIKAELIDSGKINTYIYGYNYFNRWYDFEIGGSKVSDLLLFETKMFKEENKFENIVNEVLVGSIDVGSTAGFFNSNVAKYTGSSRLQYFLDYLITNIGGYEDVNDWFTEYFGARNFLAEFGVDNRPEILYRGWYHLKMMSRMILPVITMPSDSTYMISGPAHLQFGPAQLYNKDTVTDAGKKVVRNVINNHVTLAKRHFTVLAGGFGSLKWNNYCIMCYDCTKIITGYKQGSISVGGITIPTGKIVPVYTQGRVGSNYAFFKNFSEVLGLWQPAGSSGGVGNTAGFLWFQAQPGLTNYDTWTHEFEHALCDKIMLDQRGVRIRLEDLTQGNVEQRDDWSNNNLSQDVGPGYFNTSFYLNKEGNATQNLSPDRIDTKEKMENYFKGQQNALDLLDYIEGKAFIRLTPEQQARIATKVVSASERTAWGTITTDQATQMNLTSLESLYDNQIILRPLNAWGASVRGLTAPSSTIADNYGYESVWVNRWYIDHYDSHFSGAFGIKRNFFEMLGYAGVEGYIIYGSGSRSAIGDLHVIQRITKLVTGTAMNWREYKMSRYATVEENLSNNKYIDAEYMIQRFTEALINDANNGDRNVSQRTNLRKIYYHYLKSATNDFIDDPLGTTVEVNHIKTADELVQKINAQPYGYYVLDNDIDFTNMTKNVTQTFMGRLDGNGHKIIGNKFPIFNKIRYGYVGNIVFENTDIPKNLTTAGALSYRAEMSTVEKITAKNIQMNFAGRNDLGLIGGAVSNVVTRDCSVEKLTHHISSIEDIAMLNEDTSGIFIIDNDIDFTGKTYNGSVVTNTFTGKIDGNGHTFSNLTNAGLFANFNGTVENLNVNNVSIQSTDSNIGAFAKQTSGATLRNMKFTNITINGASNLGAVVGTDNRGSVFEKISVKNFSSTSTGMFVGGLAGSQYGGRVSNVIVEGEINIAHIGAGGIIGATGNGTAVNINNVISNVKINRTGDTDTQHRKNNAGVVGFIADVSKLASITNSIALGDMLGFTDDMLPNKFVYTTESVITTKLTKCYELSEASGLSGVTSNTAGHLDVVNRNILNTEFYKNLGFDESIWDFGNISETGYPILK